jgi:DNA-binding response OmpR family regulator
MPGSCIRCDGRRILPRAARKRTTSVSESAASADDQLQVLVVDDSEDAAASLVMLLELEDISARSAPDAEAALRLVEKISPAVLLIDIGLPGMNGYELAERLRMLPRLVGSTLIALTGRDLHPGEKGSLFDQFWTKPFDPRHLLTEIKAMLSSSSQRPAAG